MTTFYDYPQDLAEKWSNAVLSGDRSRSASRNPREAKTKVNLATISLKLSKMPMDITIQQLWKAFSPEGNIDMIEIYDGRPNEKWAVGKVTFKPPPQNEFWLSRRFNFSVEGKGEQITILVEVLDVQNEAPRGETERYYPPNLSLRLRTLEFGSLATKDCMNIVETINSTEPGDVKLEMNTRRGEMSIYFPYREKQKHFSRRRQYKLVAKVSIIKKV